jgi:probable rRNA maturation factor
VPIFLADEQDVDVDADDLVALARHVLDQQRVPSDMELSLLLVDRDTIAGLNEAHLGASGPTDVLAFPIDEPGESPPDVPGDPRRRRAVPGRRARAGLPVRPHPPTRSSAC